MIALTPVSQPPVRPGLPLPRQAAPQRGPMDRVDLAEAPPAEPRSGLRAFAAVALALGALAGGAAVATWHAAPAVVKTVENTRDNPTARAVRERHADLAREVQQEREAFAATRDRLSTRGEALDRWAEAGPGLHPDGDATVTVRSGDGIVDVEWTDGTTTVSSTRAGRTWTVRESTGSRLEVTEGSTTVSDGRTTWHEEEGLFQATRPLPRGSQTLEARGKDLRDVVREVHSGYAGDVVVESVREYRTPENAIMVFPRTVLTESRMRSSRDEVTGRTVTSRETVEVRDDGSSRTVIEQPGL